MNAQRRKVTGFAVDGVNSKDLDDAIHLTSDEQGYVVTVSISDVSERVLKGSDLDSRAMQRVVTRYFAEGNSPMLPRGLSEGALSLIPNRARKVIVFEIHLSLDFEVTDVKIELGLFQSKRRYTHKDVDDILSDKSHAEHSLWRMYYKFAESLLNKRRRAGALIVYDLMSGLYTNEEGSVVRKKSGEYFRPHIIVQEFMILVNSAVTTYLKVKGVSLLYRNHTTLVEDFGQEEVLRRLYGSTETLNARVLVDLSERMRNIAGRACYGEICKGHFGLNLSAYTHWTSPIRRFADLLNHRQLVAWLQGTSAYTADELRSMGEHINKFNDDVKDRVADGYRKQAEESLKKADRGQLTRLQPGKFSHFIRMVTSREMELDEERLQVIEARIREKTLSLVDYVCILFSEVPDEVLWRRLQKNALQALVVNPGNVRASPELARRTMGWELVTQHTQIGVGRFSAKISAALGQRSYESHACEGDSKTEAEARAIVDLLRIMSKTEIDLPIREMEMSQIKANFKGILLELCNKRKWTFPTFTSSQQGPANQLLFSCVATLVRLGRDDLKTGSCVATTKKEAEQLASAELLTFLGANNQGDSGIKKSGGREVSETDWKSNPISALQEFCQKQGIALPVYDDLRNGGTDHSPSFKVQCSVYVGGSVKMFEGEGANKKEAKKKAALNACQYLFSSK